MKKAILSIALLLIITQLSAQEFRVITKVNKHVSIIAEADPNDELAVELYGVSYDKVVKIPMIYHDFDVTSKLIYLYGIMDAPNKLLMGAVNMSGEIVIPIEYDMIEDNYNGTYLLTKDNLRGVCDENGKIIVPVEYSFLDTHHEMFLSKKEGGSALYKIDGTVLVPFGRNQIQIIDEQYGVYAVNENDRFVIRFDANQSILNDYNQVSPTLFAKRTEVSIRDYFAFIADQRLNGSLITPEFDVVNAEYLLPDTNFVEKKLLPIYRNFFAQFAIEEGSNFVNYELRKSKKERYSIDIPLVADKTTNSLLDFPVTGITREQANLYTQWLTAVYNDNFYIADYDCRVSYRLPSEQEWISMAEAGLSEKMRPNHVLDSMNAEGCMLYIYKYLVKCARFDKYMAASLGGGTVKVLSMNPDWKGLYQLFGNVAEFTSEAGINKGGSFEHIATDAKTTEIQRGDGPSTWLGFRVVADLLVGD